MLPLLTAPSLSSISKNRGQAVLVQVWIMEAASRSSFLESRHHAKAWANDHTDKVRAWHSWLMPSGLSPEQHSSCNQIFQHRMWGVKEEEIDRESLESADVLLTFY